MKSVCLRFLFSFFFLVACSTFFHSCKKAEVKLDYEIDKPNKIPVKFILSGFPEAVNSNSGIRASNQTIIVAPVANMAYTVYIFNKLSGSFVDKIDAVLGGVNEINLDVNQEYVYVAVTNNQPRYLDVLNSSLRLDFLQKSLGLPLGTTDLTSMVLDSLLITDIPNNQSMKVGYASYRITYYDKVEDFGPISDSNPNVVGFNLKLVNFVLDVELDMSEVYSALQYDKFNVYAMENRLASVHAINDHSAKLRLYDGSMLIGDVPDNSTWGYTSGYGIDYLTSGAIEYATYMTKPDPNGQLIITITIFDGGDKIFKKLVVPHLYFTPGQRAKLELKLQMQGGEIIVNPKFSYYVLDDQVKDVVFNR